MKKTLLIFLILFVAFSGYPENIDSLFNHFVYSKQSQHNNNAEELVYLFNKNECYDYPITYKHLGNQRMLEMRAYLGMANMNTASQLPPRRALR